MSEAVKIELARLADAGDIAAMSRDLVERGLGWSWTPSRVARHIRDRETSVIVAREARYLAGFAIMRFFDEEAHLNLLAVRSGWRRRGIGRALVAWLEKTARVAGIGTVQLEVRASNGPARAFYLALDYRETALIRGYYGGRESAVRMLHNLRVTQAPGATPREAS